MESREANSSTIEFTEYAPLDQDYTKKELAEIYKKIITDINSGKQKQLLLLFYFFYKDWSLKLDDKNTKSIEFSEEEIDLLQELLSKHLDTCVCIHQ